MTTNKKDFDIAKKICKEHGVKGFRKLKLKRIVFLAGKQCKSINSCIALRLIKRLTDEGFILADMKTTIELAENNLLDTLSIS